jgi:hypothetical protein
MDGAPVASLIWSVFLRITVLLSFTRGEPPSGCLVWLCGIVPRC